MDAPLKTPDLARDATGAPGIRSSALVRHPDGSYVYAVRLPSGIKIGKTDNPVSTLRTFRRPCPDAHYVNVWWFKDASTAYAVERYLHALFAPAWIGGELFNEKPWMADFFERTPQGILETMAWLRSLPEEEQRRIEAGFAPSRGSASGQ